MHNFIPSDITEIFRYNGYMADKFYGGIDDAIRGDHLVDRISQKTV